MTVPPEQARAELQHLLDGAGTDEVVEIDPPRERPGPVVVRSGLTLDGKGCTIWGLAGPVVVVKGANAVLKNLRIEHTGDRADAGPAAGVALWVEGPGLALENVTVRGAVAGLAAEEGEWRYPHQLTLGSLAAGMPHALRLRVVVPVPCQLTSEVAGVTLEPRTLSPGAHEVRLRTEGMMRDTLVFGTIGIKTAFLRREIVLNAHFLAPADGLPPPATDQDRVVWGPPDWDARVAAGPPKPAAAPAPLPPIVIAPPPPRVVDVPPPEAAPARVPAAPSPPPPAPAPVADAPGSPGQPPSVPPPPAPRVPPPPVVVTPSPPPPPPSMRPTKTITGPLLGSLFTSPPVKSPPVATPDASSPPVANPPKKPGPPKPLNPLFGPKPKAPVAPSPVADAPGSPRPPGADTPGSPGQPPPADELPLAVEVDGADSPASPAPGSEAPAPAPPPPPATPKVRFRPAGGSPLWGPKPPPPPPA